MAKLKLPEGITSVSFKGTEYAPKRGIVDVPEEAIPFLLDHFPVQAASEEDAKFEEGQQ